MRNEIKNDGERFGYEDLILINCYAKDDPDRAETWASALCDAASGACHEAGVSDLCAPDFDGDTQGRTHWISVLIPRESLDVWRGAVAGLVDGLCAVSPVSVTPGRYGDGHWDGAILADDGEGLWWLE